MPRSTLVATEPVPRFATEGLARTRTGRWTAVSLDVSIIGAGLSRFGRQHGVTGRQLAVQAIHAALADAGIAWPDVQVAFGGSDGAGLADTLVAELGLTGIPFTNVKNGCATGGSALVAAVNAVRSGAAEIALAVGFDKHPRGAFDPRPEDWGLPAGYGEAGLMVTTQFFAVKIARYLREHGIDERTLAKVAAKAYRNGALNPNAWRREPMSEEQITAAAMVNDPLTQYMFCSPGEGGAAIVVATRTPPRSGSRHRRVKLLSVATRTRALRLVRGLQPLDPGPGHPAERQHRRGPRRVRAGGCGPRRHRRRAAPGHRERRGDHAPGRVRLLRARRAGEVDRRRRDRDRWPAPVNTDGGCIANGEPIGASGLRQVHEIVTQLRGEAGDRQVPGSPRLGFTHVYGAPGISACTVLEVPMTPSTGPDLDTFVADARAWLDGVAAPRTRRAWGEGSDSVAVFENWTAEQERAETDRIRAYEQAKFDAGFGADHLAAGVRRTRPADRRTCSPSGGSRRSTTSRSAPRCSRSPSS